MSDQGRQQPSGLRAEARPTTAHVAVEFQVTTGLHGPAGQRVLTVRTPFSILVFPMSIEEAQTLGRALSAPGIATGS